MTDLPASKLGGKADECASDSFFRVVEKRNRAIGIQRIGDLHKFYRHRYGGVFPDDDAGVEDLKILLHHYAWNNPLAMPRQIKLRAPWMDDKRAANLIEQIEFDPQKWRSETLGRALGLTGAEWKVLRLRTIAPIDMSRDERRAFSTQLANERKRIKHGRKTRGEYLASHNVSRDKPWEALGMSRAQWYREGKPVVRQVGCNKDSMERHTCLNRGGAYGERKGLGERRPSAVAKLVPVMVEPSQALSPACCYQPMSEIAFLGCSAADIEWLRAA